jgi:DNA-binding response OmpR family regulator
VEDSPADARVIRELLSETGAEFEIRHVVRLADAIAAVTEVGPAIVLLDLSLPDAEGLDCVRRMRTVAPASAIVVLTGRTDETIAVEALREGVEDYLGKGQVDAQALRRAIRYAVEQRGGTANSPEGRVPEHRLP